MGYDCLEDRLGKAFKAVDKAGRRRREGLRKASGGSADGVRKDSGRSAEGSGTDISEFVDSILKDVNRFTDSVRKDSGRSAEGSGKVYNAGNELIEGCVIYPKLGLNEPVILVEKHDTGLLRNWRGPLHGDARTPRGAIHDPAYFRQRPGNDL